MPVREGTRGHQACLQCADLVSLCLIGTTLGFPSDSVVKNPPGNAGDAGLIPVPGRTPGGGNGNPLRYPCLGNLMDRGAWQATVHGVAKESGTT